MTADCLAGTTYSFPLDIVSNLPGDLGDIPISIEIDFGSKIKEGKGPFGYNVLAGKFEDMVAAGVIDPALVIRTCIQNAASVAGLMLTTDVIVTELKDDDDPVDGASF